VQRYNKTEKNGTFRFNFSLLLKILLKVLCYLTEKMHTSITTTDAVIAVGVC